LGARHFPTEEDKETGEKIRKSGFEFGATTGRERRCGWIDIPALKYAIMINGVTELSMMKGDVLDTFETIKVCTHYMHNGEKIEYFPYSINDGNTTPVYKEVKGWQTDLTKLTGDDKMPKELVNYIN